MTIMMNLLLVSQKMIMGEKFEGVERGKETASTMRVIMTNRMFDESTYQFSFFIYLKSL